MKAFVALDGVRQEVVEQALPRHGAVEVVETIDGSGETWRAIEDETADVLVVACTPESNRSLSLIQEAVLERPARPVVVLCESAPETYMRRIFEAGADDIVALPEASPTVSFALHKAVARKRRATVVPGAATSPLVCVVGPKGGTGKTMIATSLAVSLAERKHRVVLVDLDLQFGDVGLSLGLLPDRTIFDLARAPGSLDADKVDAYLSEHESGLRALLAPSRPDQAGAVTTSFLRELYGVLRAANDVVVVDTAPGFTPEVVATVDQSSHVVMVSMLDTLSLKDTKLGLEALELMGYDASRVQIVLNRADSRVGVEAADVAAVLGRAPDALLPSDREIPRALTAGMPVVKARQNSAAAATLRSIAERYVRTPGATAAIDGNGALNGRGAKNGRRLLRRRG